MTVPAAIARIRLLGVLAFATFGCASARAHTPSETFLILWVSETNVAGQWDVALRDLQPGLKVDPERWQGMSAPEKARRLEGLAIDTVAQLAIAADGQQLVLRVTDLETVLLQAGEYERVTFASPTAADSPASIEIDGRALFGVDTNMHGLLRVEHRGRVETASFNAGHPVRSFTLARPAPRGAQIGSFVIEGVGHIWRGPDHLLFLLALLLPAVFRREGGRWVIEEAVKQPALRVLKIVTAFTVAHSVTLSLAVLGIVRVPARIIEPLIAASVIAAALNNLRPWFGGRGWVVACVFGLVHGFGLATGLLEFGLRGEALALALVGFNVGVELGQAALVAVLMPILFLLSETYFYRIVAFRYGSVAVVLVAAVWMAERLFAFKLLPF